MSTPRRPATVATAVALALPFACACSKNEPPIVTVTTEPASGDEMPVAIVPAEPSATPAPTESAPGVWEGVVTCGQPNTIEFDGAASEVVSFAATLTTTSSGGNPSVTLMEGSEPVLESLNAIDVSGAVAPDQPVSGRRTYNFRHSGRYSLRVAVEQCVAVRYHVVLTRDVPAATNQTRETATPITLGTPVTGTLGCEEHRWFVLESARRGTYHVTLTGTGRIENQGGDTSITLMTADGPVLESGNPVAAGGLLPNPEGGATTRDIHVPRNGRYWLDLTFWNGCAIGDYQITVTR